MRRIRLFVLAGIALAMPAPFLGARATPRSNPGTVELVSPTAASSAAVPTAPSGSGCLDLVRNWNAPDADPGSLRIADKWGRDVTHRGILLTDWEGPIGNPEILLTLQPPADAQFPVTVAFSAATRSLLYAHDAWIYGRMVLPSRTGYRHEVVFAHADDLRQLRLGVHPDRDRKHEREALKITQTDAAGRKRRFRTPVYVCDQDQNRAADFAIIVDPSADATGFFQRNRKAAKALQRIADDLAYYIGDMQADLMAAGAATTTLADGRQVQNPRAFTGTYLMAAGWRHGDNPEDVWSTGFPGATRMTSDGGHLDVFAIGTLGPHPDGDRSAVNTSGWSFDDKEKRWFREGYTQHGRSPTRDCPPGSPTCDWYHVSFYSVMKHELLHALAYEPRFPRWNGFVRRGCINDKAVTAYTGRCPPLADTVHAWDPVLHRRDWNEGPELIDKFELLVMQAVGWTLRDTTPFEELQVVDTEVAASRSGEGRGPRIEVRGGVPPYDFRIQSGALPAGMSLNRYTGDLEGDAAESGTFRITVQILDNGLDQALFFESEGRKVPKNGITERVRLTVSS